MDKIFIVTYGDYSDYSIYGVFSTSEKAQAYIDALGLSEAEIEEYNVDEFDAHVTMLKNFSVFNVIMEKNGDVEKVEKGRGRYSFECALKKEYLVYGRGVLVMYVLAKDEQHAIKIVNEKRVQLVSGVGWDRAL